MTIDDDVFGDIPYDPEGNVWEVATPSGGSFHVLTEGEAQYFEDRAERYVTQNHLTNVTDLQDVDRLLVMELMVNRWGAWLMEEKDYWGGKVDLDTLQKNVSDYSTKIVLLKKSLGMDKATRDKENSTGVAEYIENLRVRAKEFGVMRESQLTKAITLFQQLNALVQLHDNCDTHEREEMKVETEDVLAWIRDIAVPEFDAIDEHFRSNSQKYWIKDI